MELLQRIFYTALGAASIFYFVVKISLSHWKKRGILHAKPKFLWGNLKGVGRKRHITFAIEEIYNAYKGKAPFVGCYAYLKPLVLVLDLELVRHILSVDAKYFDERGLYHNADREPLSANLMQLDGKQWQHLHDKVHQIFAAEQLQILLPALLQVATTFRRSLEAQQQVQEICVVNELVDCFNVDVIGALAYGIDGDTLRYVETEFRLMTRSYLRNYSPLKEYLAWHYPNIARLFQHRSYDQMAAAYFSKLIDDYIDDCKWERKSQEQPKTFLSLLIALNRQHDRQKRITNEEIAAQAFSFITVGLSACNTTLSFCLYELALQPEVQNRARAEIEKVLQRYNETLSMNSLKELQYLKQILYETLRKHSPYPFLLRNTVNDYEVPNSVFMLKQGNNIIIPTAAIHNDPQIYPEPRKFDPERFNADSMRQRHAMAWLPFGSGTRGCVALHFSELPLLVGLVTLLRQYRYSPCAETSIPLQYNPSKLMLTPSTDIKLRVERV